MFGLIHECKSRRFSRAFELCGRSYDPVKKAFGAAGSEPQIEVSGPVPGSDAVQATVASDGGNVSAMDSAVYFVSSPVRRAVGMDLAASEGDDSKKGSENGDSCNSPLRREIVLRQAGSAVLRWPGETAILNIEPILRSEATEGRHSTSNIEN